MSISKIFVHGVAVFAAGQINQIQAINPDPGVEVLDHRSDGSVDPNLAAVILQSPVLSFETTAIKRALDIAGISGYSIAANSDWYIQKVAQGGTRSGGSTAMRFRGAKGILYPVSLSAEDRQYAMLSMRASFVSSDGTTAPLAATDSQAHPSITAADQLFTVGPVYLNGTQIEGIKSINVDFGINEVKENGSGEGYPTFNGILTRKPTITIRTTDPTALATDGWFVAQGATDSNVFFRKVQTNGLRVANATEEHIKIAIDDGIIHARTIGGGSTDQVQMHEIVIEPVYDGTNDILAISTAAAIS